jgi:hypothetical protein
MSRINIKRITVDVKEFYTIVTTKSTKYDMVYCHINDKYLVYLYPGGDLFIGNRGIDIVQLISQEEVLKMVNLHMRKDKLLKIKNGI